MMTTTWEFIAKQMESIYGTLVDWEERFFICPDCGEPIYESDFYYMPCDGTEDAPIAYCPVCKEDYEIDWEAA